MGAHSRPATPATTTTVADRETTERLYTRTLDGMDETSGDVEAPTGWFAIVPEGDSWYILIRDTLGFTHGYLMGSETHARTVYDALEAEYAAWSSQDCKEA